MLAIALPTSACAALRGQVARATEAAVRTARPGMPLPTDRVPTPHFFECGRLLAMCFGDDPMTLSALGELCPANPQAATGPLRPAYDA
jgi:hypothetical protein